VICALSWCRLAEAKTLGDKLLEAAQQGKAADVQTLLGQGADPNARGKRGRTPLMNAAGYGGEHVSIGAGGRMKSTAVASQGTAETVRALLEHGADPNAVDYEATTALYFAAQYGRLDSVRALLEAHADANLCKTNGMCPLMHASYGGHTEVVRALIAAGAAVNATPGGQTPRSATQRLRAEPTSCVSSYRRGPSPTFGATAVQLH